MGGVVGEGEEGGAGGGVLGDEFKGNIRVFVHQYQRLQLRRRSNPCLDPTIYFPQYFWDNQPTPISIPYTPRPMMRHPSLPPRLQLLHRIIQEKINQDRIDFCSLMLLGVGFPIPQVGFSSPNKFDFSPYELDAPDAAAAQLDLPGVAAGDGTEVADVRGEGWGVGEAGEVVEHLGDAVVLWGGVVSRFGGGGRILVSKRESECTHLQTW